ncbi:hypothetical protein [Candidatus Poriferisocius sp.]|uniref:hypothetical protein n=1 Tax=Candidatus Poriferisocius sp. TaxID=3101276 RepID=UPI003B019D5E
MNGDVRVKLPAAQGYARMAEIAAEHAATHQGFPPDEVADLSQAIKEAVLLLLDPELPDGSMAFDYQSKAGIVTVEAQIEQRGRKPIPHDRIDRFESTAGSLVDSWKLDPDEHRLWLQKSANSNST